MIKKFLSIFFMLFFFVVLILILITYLENKWKSPNPNDYQKEFPELVLLNPEFPNELLDLKNFHYKLNNENACNDFVKYIWIITSFADHVELRSAIRRAYPERALKSLGIQRMFLLAQVPQGRNFVSQNALENENNRFHDLIQGNFNEAYRNLTYKHIMGLKWVVEFCPYASFIIKMDDDIVVDLYNLKNILESYDLSNAILGYVFNQMKPIRILSNKWFVSFKEYSKTKYPAFVSGWLYVTSPQVAVKLLMEASKVPFFWVDDVFVTGILAENSQVKLIDQSKIFSVHYEYIACCLQELDYRCDFNVGPNGGNNNLIINFQQLASKCYHFKCKKRNYNLTQNCIVNNNNNNNIYLGRGESKIKNLKLFNIK